MGIEETMKEFGSGSLHSGSKSGPVVKSRSQAIAIGMSQQRKMAGKPNPARKAALAMMKGAR